jgi:hypothetical protein
METNTATTATTVEQAAFAVRLAHVKTQFAQGNLSSQAQYTAVKNYNAAVERLLLLIEDNVNI